MPEGLLVIALILVFFASVLGVMYAIFENDAIGLFPLIPLVIFGVWMIAYSTTDWEVEKTYIAKSVTANDVDIITFDVGNGLETVNLNQQFGRRFNPGTGIKVEKFRLGTYAGVQPEKKHSNRYTIIQAEVAE
jgi:hypothetical protein